MLRKIFFLIILLISFTGVLFSRDNFVVVSRNNLGLDDSLTNKEFVKYSRPQKILITRLNPAHEYLLNDTKAWIRLLHYYGTTRMGLPDIPFNYVVDRSGNIYEGLENAEGRVPYLENEDGAILLGYFSSSADLTMPAQEAFKNLVENYSYKFGIPKTKVEAVDVFLSQGNEENAPRFLEYKSSEGLFQVNILEMAQKFKYSKESNLLFSGKVENLEYKKDVNSGDNLKVNFSLKNNDSFPWYVDEGLIFLSTADRKDSPFAINKVWDSFTRPLSLTSQVILPGSSVDLAFELSTDAVLPGKYEEKFKFVTLYNTDVKGTEFEVNFDINRGEKKVVQIRPTGTGALTVYGCPEYTCEMVAAAISGEKYLVLEEKGNWYKISVDGVEGYVTIHYATLVD
jgi:hypothetical protein